MRWRMLEFIRTQRMRLLPLPEQMLQQRERLIGELEIQRQLERHRDKEAEVRERAAA